MPPKKTAPVVPAKPRSVGPFTIAKQTIYLDLPEISARRLGVSACVRDGVLGDRQTALLLVSACIGLCWEGGQRKTGAPRYAFRMLEYGEAVFEWLLEEGRAAGRDEPQTTSEIIEAGNAALQLCLDGHVTVPEEDLEEAKGNSSAPEGAGSASA